MKRYIVGLVAVIVALSVFAFSKPEKKQFRHDQSMVDFYYRFDGIHGEENIMSKWTQISAGAYDSLQCPNINTQGCKIVNSTNSGSHPTLVPLSGAGGFPVNVAPNSLVVNKN